MKNIVLKKTYRCFISCHELGCPTHEARVSYNYATNNYTYNNGKGKIENFSQTELDKLLSLLELLGSN